MNVARLKRKDKMKNILITAAVIVAVLLVVNKNAYKEPKEWEEYVVRGGDTVCDIAIEITPNSRDYRHTQDYIIKKNNIEFGIIYPGQVLSVPVYEEGSGE